MAGHPRNPGYIPGDHWVVCDICGIEYRESEMKLTWDKLVLCPEDYDPRHPQDFVRGVTDDIAAKGLVRPPASQDNFISTICTTRESVAGEAVAGCAIAGFTEPTIPTPTF